MENLIYFTGISKKGDTVAYHIRRGRRNTSLVPIEDFLYGYYQPKDVALGTWGLLRGGHKVVNYAIRNGLNYYYFDNEYLPMSQQTIRVTRNAFQVQQFKKASSQRTKYFKDNMYPWRNRGNHILVCPPSEAMTEYFGLHDWLDKTLQVLRKNTSREIKVRYKPAKIRIIWREDGCLDSQKIRNAKYMEEPNSLEDDLENCHALVTFNSSVAFKALMKGIPAFTDPICSAALLGNTDFSKIENPLFLNRLELFYTLSFSQWSIQELRSHMPWQYT